MLPEEIRKINIPSTPSAGVTMTKDDSTTNTLRIGMLPKSEIVRTAQEVPNAAKKALGAQLGRGTPTGGKLGDATTQPQAGAPAKDEGGL